MQELEELLQLYYVQVYGDNYCVDRSSHLWWAGRDEICLLVYFIRLMKSRRTCCYWVSHFGFHLQSSRACLFFRPTCEPEIVSSRHPHCIDDFFANKSNNYLPSKWEAYFTRPIKNLMTINELEPYCKLLWFYILLSSPISFRLGWVYYVHLN